MTNFKPKHDPLYLDWLLKRQSDQLDVQENLWASSVLSTVKLESEPTGLKHIRKEQTGIAVEHLIQARLLAKGLVVSQPSISTGYDLLVDWGGVINRVQIRSTAVEQHITRGPSTNHYYRVKSGGLGNYTVLIVYIIPIDVMYIIPWHEMKGKQTLNFPVDQPSPYDEYKQNYDILKTTH